jgi:adenylate cyclase class 2
MGYEVEVKYRVPDHGDLASELSRRGVLGGSPVVQDDIYLAHPTRDFGDTDEALRIRCEGNSNFLTYKGPRQAGPTKTREEIEIPLAEGLEVRADVARLLERLGFRVLLQIRKARLPFRLSQGGRPMVVTLDRVDGVGAFAEVEAFALNQSDLPSAQQAVLHLAEELGLTEVEPRSYLRMALEHAGLIPPGKRT